MNTIQPVGWAAPRGYSNGIAADGPGRTIYVAGQIAWDADQKKLYVTGKRWPWLYEIEVVDAETGETLRPGE